MAENVAEPRDREPEIFSSSVSRRRRLPAIPRLRTVAGNRLDGHRGALTAEHNGDSLTDVGATLKCSSWMNDDDLQPRSDGGEMRHRLRIRMFKSFLKFTNFYEF